MDRQFWVSLSKNDYQVPEGYSLENLADILFSYLGSTDPELRDEIAYIVYANWLKREMISGEILKSHVERLLANLDKGIGESELDTVFLRSFSVLLLAEIVHNDNKKPLLEQEQIRTILSRGLWYLDAEQDPRGYVPVKGWAHALAHTADLLLVLARNRAIEAAELEKMLQALSRKITHSGNTVYVHGEDDRLANAILEILRRDLVPVPSLENWMGSFAAPDGGTWKGAFAEEDRNRAFQNTRNLMRSLHLELVSQPAEFPHKESLIHLLFDTLRVLSPFG